MSGARTRVGTGYGRLGALTLGGSLVAAVACTGLPADLPPTASPASAIVRPPGSVGVSPGVSVEDLPRVPWEGGPAYYEGFAMAAASGWTRPDFFPIGVWYESVTTQQDVDLDRAAGLTTYFELTPDSDLELVRRSGMTALTSEVLPGHGPETVGWLINDEVDMWAGAGDSQWTGYYPGQGPSCIPEDTSCGWTVMDTLSGRLPAGDGRMRYANFGKGMMMWLDDADSSRFVNDWTDIASADIYWYTDGNICDEAENFLAVPKDQCRTSAGYGRTMDRVRAFDAEDGQLQPVLAFVQVGWPAVGDQRAIRPEEIAGAVMNSIIHEARGIIYFNHNFGGPCISQHVLRDECGAGVRPKVVEVNQQLRRLAPVLNTQSLQYTFNPALDTMFKEHDGAHYVFAMPGAGTPPGPYSFTLPPGLSGAQVEVLFEDRSLPVVQVDEQERMFSDVFDAEHTYHIYKIIP